MSSTIDYEDDGVLDASHTTTGLVIPSVGTPPTTNPDWIVRKKSSDINTIEIVNGASGSVFASGKALYTLLDKLNKSSDFKDGHQILIKAGRDRYKANEPNPGHKAISAATFTKDVTIWGYDASVRGGSNTTQSGGSFRQMGHQKYLKIYGLTMDSTENGSPTTKRLGNMVSGGRFEEDITPKLIHLKDCKFLNVFNRGVHIETQRDGQGDCTVIIQDCYFDSSKTVPSIQTFLGINSSKYLYVDNCKFYGNNHVYSAARNISFTNCLISHEGMPSDAHYGGVGLQGQNIYLGNVTILYKKSSGLSLRSYGTIHAGYLFSKADRIVVKDCTFQSLDGSSRNIFITPYDDSEMCIDECIVSNCKVTKGRIVLTGTAPPDNKHGKIKKLVIDGCTMDSFDSANTIAVFEDNDFDYIRLANNKTPSVWPKNGSPVVFKATKYGVIASYVALRESNSHPQTSPQGWIATLVDSAPLGQDITVTMEAPLTESGQSKARMLGTGSGAGKKTLRFAE